MSLVQLQSSIANTLASTQYGINTVYNSMPFGIPIMTISLIGVTSMVLAYVTLVENGDSSEQPATSGESMIPTQLPTLPEMPKMPDLGISNAISSIAPKTEDSGQPTTAQVGGKNKKTPRSKKLAKKTRKLHKKP